MEASIGNSLDQPKHIPLINLCCLGFNYFWGFLHSFFSISIKFERVELFFAFHLRSCLILPLGERLWSFCVSSIEIEILVKTQVTSGQLLHAVLKSMKI